MARDLLSTAVRLALLLCFLGGGYGARKPFRSQAEKVARLRQLLNGPVLTVMPCCYDGITSRLVEDAGFELTFMTGFGVSAAAGLPDTGLVTQDEMVRAAQVICSSTSIPCIGDGDTGFGGNEMNIKRTVQRYAASGLAGIMIEDQVLPKRCGHTEGKEVVGREEAYRRVRAAVDARNEGQDIVILARTDARATLGLDEAIERCRVFRELGADWTFLEAPQSLEEMARYCQAVSGPKLANMLEGGKTPIRPPSELQALGFSVAAYPLTLLSASMKIMKTVLGLIKTGTNTDHLLTPFQELQQDVGFVEYDAALKKYYQK